jgi:hypothetical protein
MISPSLDHDFYQRFRGNTISIAHLGPDRSNISYNAFGVDPEGKLITRSKHQVLMQGPYGTVFAESTYYYGEQYNQQPTDFHVDLYFNEGSHVPAQQVAAINEAGALSAISIVRIFRAPPEFLVVCGTYDSGGRLLVLSVNGSENGNWVHSSEIQALYPDLDVCTLYVVQPKPRNFFGLPETFPIAAYLKEPQSEAQTVSLVINSDP